MFSRSLQIFHNDIVIVGLIEFRYIVVVVVSFLVGQ